jgi:GNAT superfamily N-acetyltransferase
MMENIALTEVDHSKEFLQYALEQAHPLLLEWYGESTLTDHLFEDVQRDAREFFSDDFAAKFGGRTSELGIAPKFFKHHLLEVSGRRLIAGIRFFGMDIQRPFVDVARISKPLEHQSQQHEISQLLAKEFAIFKPTRWRIFQASHLEYQFAGCDPDKRVIAGLLSTINAQPKPADFKRLELKPAINLEFYPRYEALYQDLYAQRPWLSDVAHIETLEDLQQYLEHDKVFEIFVDGLWAGITIAARDQEYGLKGWLMIEIVLESRWQGQGLGVAVQRQLATQLEDTGQDTLFGTIGAVNMPMQRTAAKVGRVDLGGEYWVNL